MESEKNILHIVFFFGINEQYGYFNNKIWHLNSSTNQCILISFTLDLFRLHNSSHEIDMCECLPIYEYSFIGKLKENEFFRNCNKKERTQHCNVHTISCIECFLFSLRVTLLLLLLLLLCHLPKSQSKDTHKELKQKENKIHLK